MDEEEAADIDKIFVYIVGYGCGALCLFGLLGNVLTLIVLTRPSMRAGNSNLYLIALSLYDMFYLALSLIVTCLDWIVYGADPLSLFNLEFTVPAAVVMDPIILVAVAGSVYTTVALTIDRCIAVVRPLHWSSLCTRFRIKVILGLVFLWSIFINGPFFAEFKLVERKIHSLGKTYILPEETAFARTYFHSVIYLKYLVPATTMALPVLVIFLCNVVIIVKVTFKRTDITSTQNAREKAKDGNRLTAQVLFISLLTLTSRVLHATMYVKMTSEGVSYINLCSFSCAVLAAVSTFMITVNSAVNFVCYCYFGKKFRTIFLTTFPCLKCPRKTKLSRSITIPFTISKPVSGASKKRSSSTRTQTTTTTTTGLAQ